MFTMNVPYVPPQETPIVLAQAATLAAGSNTQQSDYVLKVCQETESTGDPRSAMRAVDPAGMLAVYLGNRGDRAIYSDQPLWPLSKSPYWKVLSMGKLLPKLTILDAPHMATTPCQST